MNEVQAYEAGEQSNAGSSLIGELREYFGEPDGDEARLSRRLFKITACGAYLSMKNDCLTIGSIVEGCDFGTEEHVLTMSEYLDMGEGDVERWLDSTIQAVEDEASYIWQQTHGCENCNVEGEWGHDAIDPNCGTCKGDGDII